MTRVYNNENDDDEIVAYVTRNVDDVVKHSSIADDDCNLGANLTPGAEMQTRPGRRLEPK